MVAQWEGDSLNEKAQLTAECLKDKTYRQLQALAKTRGIKANMRAAELMEALAQTCGETTRAGLEEENNPAATVLLSGGTTAQALDKQTSGVFSEDSDSPAVPMVTEEGHQDGDGGDLLSTVGTGEPAPTTTVTEDALRALPYGDLRQLAKKSGVRASGKAVDMIGAILTQNQVRASDTVVGDATEVPVKEAKPAQGKEGMEKALSGMVMPVKEAKPAQGMDGTDQAGTATNGGEGHGTVSFPEVAIEKEKLAERGGGGGKLALLACLGIILLAAAAVAVAMGHPSPTSAWIGDITSINMAVPHEMLLYIQGEISAWAEQAWA